MKKSDLTYLLGATFVTFTGFFYCCTMWFAVKLPRYYPVEHVWKFVKEKGVPSQAWYGKQGFAYICAAVVTLGVYLAIKAFGGKMSLKPGLTKGIGLVTLAATVVFMLCIMEHEFVKWQVF